MFLENQLADERISRAIDNDHTEARKSGWRKRKGGSSRSVCMLCQKRFKSASFYRRHLRLHQEGGKGPPFLCSLCPKAFSIKSSLQRHMNCHTGEKPFVCGICQRGYTRRSVLALHVQQVHECRKPFQCDACGKKLVN